MCLFSVQKSNVVDESSAQSNVQPPEDFHLQPIRDKLFSEVRISLTEATNKPFEDLGVFADIDKHASEVKFRNENYTFIIYIPCFNYLYKVPDS